MIETRAYPGGGMIQKWEYTEIMARVAVNQDPITPEVIRVNGDRAVDKGTDYPKLYSFINQLGEQGWEVVGLVRGNAHYYGQTDYLFCYLKRPIQEQQHGSR